MKARRDSQTKVVQAMLAKLRKALPETESCLIKNGIIPGDGNARENFDLTKLKPQLWSLSKKLRFDCLELAEIIHTRQGPPLLDRYKPAKEAAEALLTHAKAIGLCVDPIRHKFVMQESYPINEITSAVQKGDVEFFVKLGNYLSELRRKKPRKKEPAIDQDYVFRASVDRFWKPDCDWPGLAYCKNSTRLGFLFTFLETKGYPTRSLKRGIGPKEFDNIRGRLGLKPAKHPFISKIEFLPNGTVRFS
jgi:hypothetical protein